jgi:transcriptional regulator with XRE-family HTH domain
MVLLRRVIGDALRARRQGQHRTLREVSTAANVSLGYLSEIERGQKEASSELLAAICEALGARLSELLGEVSSTLALAEGVDGVLMPVGDAHAPMQTAPARSAPAQSAPMKSAPAQSAPAQSAPAQSAPAQSAPAQSAPAQSASTRSAPMKSAPVQAAQAKSAEAAAVRQVATDGKVSVSVLQDTPLKATLRATRKRERDIVYAA